MNFINSKAHIYVCATILTISFTMRPANSAVFDQCDPSEQRIIFSIVTELFNHPKGEAAMNFARAFDDLFQARMCMVVYANSEISDDTRVFELIKSGEVQFAAPSVAKFGAFTDALQIFDIPFLFKNELAVEWFLGSEEGQDLLNNISTEDFVFLGFWSNGMYQFSADVDFRNPEFASGQIFRVQSEAPVIARLIELLDAEYKVLPFSRLGEALRTGEVNAQYNTWANIFDTGVHILQDAIFETNHAYLGYPVIVARNFLDSLGAEDRESLVTAFELITHEQNGFSYEINQKRKSDITSAGGNIVSLSEIELELWRTKLRSMYEEFRTVVSEDVLNAINKSNSIDPFNDE